MKKSNQKIKEIKIIDLINKKSWKYLMVDIISRYAEMNRIPFKILIEKVKSKRYNHLTLILKTLFKEHTFFDFQDRGLIEPGHPDFMIELKNGRRIYIELKNVGDSLRASQIEWIYNNPKKYTLILFCLDSYSKDINKIKKSTIMVQKKIEKIEEVIKKDRRWEEVNPFK